MWSPNKHNNHNQGEIPIKDYFNDSEIRFNFRYSISAHYRVIIVKENCLKNMARNTENI